MTPHTDALWVFLMGFLMSDCSVGKYECQVGKFVIQVGKSDGQVGKITVQVGIVKLWNLRCWVSPTGKAFDGSQKQ